MNYLAITLEDVRRLARRHGCEHHEAIDFADDTLSIWVSNNYRGCEGVPGDIDELCSHACIVAGTYIKGEITQEEYLRAMQNIDHKLRRYYMTSLEREWT